MARIDTTQNFIEGWNLEPEETGFPPGSMEALFWPSYRELFAAIGQHSDAKSLRWHVRTLELLREQVLELIAGVEAD